MTDNRLNILIVGGGIAGCSSAIALTNAGHKVRIIEKQTEWRFQSSGIFVYSNGLESMQALGVMDEMVAAGFIVPKGRNIYYDHRGMPIVDTFYPSPQNGKVPAILGIKRAEMHRVLAARMAALDVTVDLGLTIDAIEQSENAAIVTLTDGSQISVDLVIGADGVSSATRDMIGAGVEPRYTGFGVWRSVHQRPADLTDKIMMMGPAKRYGIMPISDDRLYTFGTVAEPEDSYFPPEDWIEIMKARFAEFSGPASRFLDNLDDGSEVLYTAVQEVVMPLPWHRGRVVLIGDAAHASTPFMGQGGAMAIQDALVLTRALKAHNKLDHALTAFGQARYPVCQFVQDVSRRVGEAGAQEDVGNLAVRHAKLAETAQTAVDDFYGKLAALNSRADAVL